MSGKIKFEERPYRGMTLRPRPECLLDHDSRLLIVATPWGPRSAANKAVELISEYYLMAKSDNEATSPFEKVSSFSNEANHLRTAVMLANEAIYRDENKTELKAGVELFAASFIQNEFVWIQVGQPHLLLSRKNGHLLPLGSSVDLSTDLSESSEPLPALPNQLLGIEPTANLTLNSFRAQPGDRLVLLSHSVPPVSLYTMKHDELTLDNMSKRLAQIHPDGAFWLGVIELPDLNERSELTA